MEQIQEEVKAVVAGFQNVRNKYDLRLKLLLLVNLLAEGELEGTTFLSFTMHVLLAADVIALRGGQKIKASVLHTAQLWSEYAAKVDSEGLEKVAVSDDLYQSIRQITNSYVKACDWITAQDFERAKQFVERIGADISGVPASKTTQEATILAPI